MAPPKSQRPVRRGEIVEVRPPAEILASLDENGALGGLPFMPEMFRYAGRRFRVSTRVEKFCDTIQGSGGAESATLSTSTTSAATDQSRVCRAACRLYWNKDWFVRVGENGESSPARDDQVALAKLERLTRAAPRGLSSPKMGSSSSSAVRRRMPLRRASRSTTST
jgi:hypothetical protein